MNLKVFSNTNFFKIFQGWIGCGIKNKFFEPRKPIKIPDLWKQKIMNAIVSEIMKTSKKIKVLGGIDSMFNNMWMTMRSLH